MMTFLNEPLRLGYEISGEHIPGELSPVIREATEIFKAHHDGLASLYIIGSMGVGEWQRGISDLDLVGITTDDVDPETESSRKKCLWELGGTTQAITYVDNVTISSIDVNDRRGNPVIAGHLFKLATTGIPIWGEPGDFGRFLPPVQEVAYSRTARAATLMDKYRDGNLIQPFRDDPRLLTRSCAKAAMRVLSSMTIMRGALFQVSPYRTAEDVNLFVPEATEIKDRAVGIIADPERPAKEAMKTVDNAVTLFGELFPAAASPGKQNQHPL